MLKGLVTSLWSSETKTPGGGGSEEDEGNMIQYLEPLSCARSVMKSLTTLRLSHNLRNDGIPSTRGIWILVKRAPAPLWSNYEPAVVRPLIS